ncbi:NADPH:quinone reductase [Chamaesiphon polymorphus]|nr:NADPH:quinone reductase [Chamaesiphon polymorphus]
MNQPTMPAAWYDRQGEASEVLQVGELPLPEPGVGEVRVRIHASGVNPSDTKSRAGWGGIVKSFDLIIPHQDGAGVIESVGAGVSPTRIGERVWIYEAQLGRPFGTAAAYVVVPDRQAVHLPDNTSYAEGACLGVPAMTAHRAVFADGDVRDRIMLVTGGAGAVGNYAVQWAKWGGAKVIATVSRPEQAEIATTAGADYTIDYKREDVVQRIREITGKERGIDRVVDVNFAANMAISDATLRTNGGVALYAGNPGDLLSVPLLPWMLRNITIRTILVYTMPQAAKAAAIRDITTALETAALRHNIASTFSLERVAAAHTAQDSGQAIGKIVIDIA